MGWWGWLIISSFSCLFHGPVPTQLPLGDQGKTPSYWPLLSPQPKLCFFLVHVMDWPFSVLWVHLLEVFSDSQSSADFLLLPLILQHTPSSPPKASGNTPLDSQITGGGTKAETCFSPCTYPITSDERRRTWYRERREGICYRSGSGVNSPLSIQWSLICDQLTSLLGVCSFS